MASVLAYFLYILICIVLTLLFLLLFLLYRFQRGKRKITRNLRCLDIKKIENDSGTTSVEILPLIDWYTKDENLIGEAGVSYLVKTDETTILFDVGRNQNQIHPSPLLHNMSTLGITVSDFDTIFISHNHMDHVGGFKFMRRKSFSLTNYQIPLEGKRIYTPIRMTYPAATPIQLNDPTVIAKGVCSIGVIPSQLFFLGCTLEQALACRVNGKGIVLIVGCGHQGLSRILERVDALFEDPLYGVIGGLHYPVTGGRESLLGMPIEKYVGTRRPPWRPITKDDVNKNIALLKSKNPKIVALSAHDSCDWTLEAFRKAFHNSFKDLRVGEKIQI